MVTEPQFPAPLELTYLVPLRAGRHDSIADLAGYLRELATHVGQVLVVDGSEPDLLREHQRACGTAVTLIATELRTRNGKVGNVITGLRHARHEAVVIADDDVRYRIAQLARVTNLLERADVVRPQNYFAPLPWHARFDTARTLLNRLFTGDWPGTLVVRKTPLLATGGYAGDVMFENFELVRTVKAAGGRELLALDVLVERRPPTAGHFWSQQIRQAYDEFARPHRLFLSLVTAPAVVVLIARRRVRIIVSAAVTVAALAEVGRRRAGGRLVFPATSVLLAPPWLLWRSLCSWAAIAVRLRGGVRYRGDRLRRAASPRRVLRERVSQWMPLQHENALCSVSAQNLRVGLRRRTGRASHEPRTSPPDEN